MTNQILYILIAINCVLVMTNVFYAFTLNKLTHQMRHRLNDNESSSRTV